MIITNTSEFVRRELIKIALSIDSIKSSDRTRLISEEDALLQQNYNRVIICERHAKTSWQKYIHYTSLPFKYVGRINVDECEDAIELLRYLWKKHDCTKCKKDVVHRYTMPTGNMQPKYMLVGEAPGVSDGEKKLERVMVNGPTSILLRTSLELLGVLRNCWFTNVMKCSFDKNQYKDDKPFENCSHSIIHEVLQLQPQKIILMGRNTQNFMRSKLEENKLIKKNCEIVDISHPSFCLYKGMSPKDYAKRLEKIL